MARNRTRNMSGGRKDSKITPEQNLPQNIVPVGEISADGEKRIYISQSAYNIVHKFAKSKTDNERGGVLVGCVIQEFGKTNIVVQGFIEAKFNESTSTTLKFTHETWEYVHKEIARKYENGKIVGWIHTHPNFGIFLSEYDMFIHSNFFSDENQIAYVIDPIQHDEGVYCWANGKIEHCRGFYVYDQPDKIIRLTAKDGSENSDESVYKASAGKGLIYGLIAALALAVISFALISFNLFSRISILESQQETTLESTDRKIAELKSQAAYHEQDLYVLESAVNEIVSAINYYHGAPEVSADSSAEEKETIDVFERIFRNYGNDKQKETSGVFRKIMNVQTEENP